VSYVVLGIAAVFEGGAWFFALTEFRQVKGARSYLEAVHRGKDPSMFVVLFEDSAAMLGLVAAFLGIFISQITGEPRFDGAASIVIGCILGGTAIWLAYETKGLLIGESANREVVRTIRELTERRDSVEHVNEVLTMHMGPDYILVNLSVEFRDSITADDLEREIASLDRSIKEAVPRVKRVFVEAEARRAQAT
jgi:divalent metal cation (Fe/Co/Zn/Cd) transporter